MTCVLFCVLVFKYDLGWGWYIAAAVGYAADMIAYKEWLHGISRSIIDLKARQEQQFSYLHERFAALQDQVERDI